MKRNIFHKSNLSVAAHKTKKINKAEFLLYHLYGFCSNSIKKKFEQNNFFALFVKKDPIKHKHKNINKRKKNYDQNNFFGLVCKERSNQMRDCFKSQVGVIKILHTGNTQPSSGVQIVYHVFKSIP